MIEKTVIPDAVFFDMDGLLLDSEVVSLQCFNELVAAHGLHDHESVFVSLIGTNEDAQQVILQNALGKLLNVEAFWRDWKSAYTRITSSRAIPLKQGAHALLGWLHAKGVPCVVATSTQTRDAQRMLDMAGVLPFLAGIVGGDQVSRSKPQPDIYLAAMALVNAEGSRSLGLEDSANGVRAAVSAGLRVVQVPDLVEPNDELLALGHIVCKDLHEVLQGLQEDSLPACRFAGCDTPAL